MAEETRKLVVTQPEDVGFALVGSECDPPLRHRLGGGVTIGTDTPIVHMHLWDEDRTVKHQGEVVLRGDAEAPVVLEHSFPDVHHQSHVVKTGLAEPIHHALQMRTPLQLRFCNSWQIASDYTIGVDLAGRRLMGIRITGATVATPQPCPEDGCPPAPPAVHP